MSQNEVTLLHDCAATVIPAGTPLTLPGGRTYYISQALGGSVTLRDRDGLYRVAPDQFVALGPEVAKLAAAGAIAPADGAFGEEQLWHALRGCYDPEIPVNIVDLGLIYDLSCTGRGDGTHDVSVKMTLTATGCGMGPVIADDARAKLEALPGVHAAHVEIVWDPQWTPQMISPEGRSILGLD
jgi:probable FeS assembly SUF system protein SufT